MEREGEIVFVHAILFFRFFDDHRFTVYLVTRFYGKAVPDFDLTSEVSELLMAPFTVTSSRKFELVTVCPDCDLVWLISDELTAPLTVVSPTRTRIAPDTYTRQQENSSSFLNTVIVCNPNPRNKSTSPRPCSAPPRLPRAVTLAFSLCAKRGFQAVGSGTPLSTFSLLGEKKKFRDPPSAVSDPHLRFPPAHLYVLPREVVITD